MTTQAFPLPGKETYEAVVSAISELKDAGSSHITICWPTNTTALFMRRRLMKDMSGTFAIRNTTARDLETLLNETRSEDSIYTRAQSMDDFALLARISRVLFPQSSAWRKIELIDETLALVSHLSDENLQKVAFNFPLASRCSELYKEFISEQSPPAPLVGPATSSVNIEHLVGDCIMVHHEVADEHAVRLCAQYPDAISHLITSQRGTLPRYALETKTYENPLSEIDSVLTLVIDSCKETSPTDMAVVVPSAAYKRYVIESAHLRGIPIAGASPKTLNEHEFIAFAHFVLSLNEPIDTQEAALVLEQFPWVGKSTEATGLTIVQLVECIEKLTRSTSVCDFFQPIVHFLSATLNIDHFTQTPEIQSLAQKSFAILLDLAECNETATPEDVAFLLAIRANIPLRSGKIGEGIYVALPQEIVGSYFSKLFVVGLNDKYVVPSPVKSTLINRDQYLTLDLPDPASAKEQASSITRWLVNASDELRASSSKFDLGGKEITHPFWCTPQDTSEIELFAMCQPITQSEIDSFLNDLLSSEPTNANITYSRDLPSHMSATSIEQLATCPAKYFNRHLLRISDEYVSINPDLLDKADMGTELHALLESYIRDDLSVDDLRSALTQRLVQLHSEGKLPHLASIEINRKRMNTMINTFLKLMEDKSPLSSEVEVEIHGQFSVGARTVDVKGKVDRVDHYSDNRVRLIDYKTGKHHEISSKDFYQYGRRIQMAVYACILEPDIAVNGFEYWYLAEKSATRALQETTRDTIDHLRTRIIEILSITETGLFPARDTNVKSSSKGHSEIVPCEQCEFDQICFFEFRNLWSQVSLRSDVSAYVRATTERSETP